MRIGYARERQAGVTRIVEATRQLLKSEGYVGMTIEAIAQRAACMLFSSRKREFSRHFSISTPLGPVRGACAAGIEPKATPESVYGFAARIPRQIRRAKVQHSICCEVQAWLHRAHKVGETARICAMRERKT